MKIACMAENTCPRMGASRQILATGVRTGVRMVAERACFVGWLVGCKRPVTRLHPSHPASLQSGLFLCLRFVKTWHGEKRPAAMRHTPPMLKAVEGQPKLQPSLKGIMGAGRYANWNDAELSYCVNAQLPDDATAPKGRGYKVSRSSLALGSLYPKSSTHQRAVHLRVNVMNWQKDWSWKENEPQKIAAEKPLAKVKAKKKRKQKRPQNTVKPKYNAEQFNELRMAHRAGKLL